MMLLKFLGLVLAAAAGLAVGAAQGKTNIIGFVRPTSWLPQTSNASQCTNDPLEGMRGHHYERRFGRPIPPTR